MSPPRTRLSESLGLASPPGGGIWNKLAKTTKIQTHMNESKEVASDLKNMMQEMMGKMEKRHNETLNELKQEIRTLKNQLSSDAISRAESMK